MSSGQLGEISSGPEVTHISSHGIWVLAEAEEFFLPYEDFPWFRSATVTAVLNLEQPTPGHLYWPDLDVDLSVDTLRNPDRFPLKAKSDA